jgi:hypothetical protein
MSSAMPGVGAPGRPSLLTAIADMGCVASVVPVTSSTAICSGLPVHLGRAHPRSYGHQITREDLRRPCSPPSSLAAFWYGASTVSPVDTSPRTSLVGRFREG